MFRREKRIPEMERLNLVPIMDAVFIFIFFLLFSAQFIKIFEIETHAPIVSEVPPETKQDKDPLNLTIKITGRQIQVLTGVDGNIRESYSRKDKTFGKKLKKLVMDLRKKHSDEDHVIIAPLAEVDFSEIVKVIEAVQLLPQGMKEFKLRVKGEEKKFSKIFNQVVLEPLSEF